MIRSPKFLMCLRLAVLGFLLNVALTAHAGTVKITLTGAGGAEEGLGSNYADGEYLMPYYVSINNGPPVAVICDDYNHTVSIGEQWTATISTFSNLSDTRFGVADSTQYHEAAWIASQISSSSSLATITGAQFAIWALFSSNTPMVAGEASWLSLASSAAAHGYWGMDFSHWEIITPLSPDSPQEYLIFVPEPGVLLNLFVGLTVLVLGLRFRRGQLASGAVQRTLA
jgi:hypothetical protein